MKRRWAKAGEDPPIGTVRRSQLITTFGAGAMIDLVDRSALVGDLDFWHYETLPRTRSTSRASRPSSSVRCGSSGST